MKAAITQKLSEDHGLTSALFANSNISILIDILSYMYQTLMANLRLAASESMFSDTFLFENATRLARLIGYYAKGGHPYTVDANILLNGKPQDSRTVELSVNHYLKTTLGFGPYSYDFALVDNNVGGDTSKYRFALGHWEEATFTGTGESWQEFVLSASGNDLDNSKKFISQQYIHVTTTKANATIDADKVWYKTDVPLLIAPNSGGGKGASIPGGLINVVDNESDQQTYLYNLFLDENENMVIRFGDGVMTHAPGNGDSITVRYIVSSFGLGDITQAAIDAIANSDPATLTLTFEQGDWQVANENLKKYNVVPVTKLSGFKAQDDAESIKTNALNSFNRQNRLVTKDDYRSFILENNSVLQDVFVQNNWEYVSTFYGFLYSNGLKVAPQDGSKYLNPNTLSAAGFNTIDAADPNNVYIWALQKNAVSPTDLEYEESTRAGVSNLIEITERLNGLKSITENIIFLNPLCKRFVPYAADIVIDSSTITNSSTAPIIHNPLSLITSETGGTTTNIITVFGKGQTAYAPSTLRFYLDATKPFIAGRVNAKICSILKTHLFDNIMLGNAPSISALLKDLMSIEGVTNITTRTMIKKPGSDEYIVYERQGIYFLSWTSNVDNLLVEYEDAVVAPNLPSIAGFQYYIPGLNFDQFISNFVELSTDYTKTSSSP